MSSFKAAVKSLCNFSISKKLCSILWLFCFFLYFLLQEKIYTEISANANQAPNDKHNKKSLLRNTKSMAVIQSIHLLFSRFLLFVFVVMKFPPLSPDQYNHNSQRCQIFQYHFFAVFFSLDGEMSLHRMKNISILCFCRCSLEFIQRTHAEMQVSYIQVV